MNLYAYAGNNPVAFSDPFGLLTCDPPDEPCLNLVKAAVGAVNVVRGVAGAASGSALLTAGALTAPLGPIAVPSTAWGYTQLSFGLANVNRGAQQLAESGSDAHGPSLRNLWGLAPFGQEYDDPDEPSPTEYWSEAWKRFTSDPVHALTKSVKDFFAIE